MSDLQNPLFEEEKEFLERKKLEYERALRGDVDHLKDQSVRVGKIAAVGAGLAGGIWLITKAFGSKKKKRNPYAKDEDYADGFNQPVGEEEADAEYYTAGNGKRYKSKVYHKSAADSARAFVEHQEHAHEADDLGFGAAAAHAHAAAPSAAHQPATHHSGDFEDDPFQDLPYDDSRRLPTSHAFDDEEVRASLARRAGSGSRMVGQVLQSFLQSDTGKVLVGQVAAVALALVTKKVSEFFPAPKNSDLATSSGYAPAETGAAPVASSVPLDSPDASTQSHSL